MSLRFVILSALAPLILIVCLLAYMRIEVYQTEARRQAAIGQVAAGTDIVGDLIHELQKERGMSAGYTSSGGRNFADQIAMQRDDTDAALVPFRDAIEDLGGYAPDTLERALSGLQSLDDERGAITALQRTVPQLAGYYTGVIDALMASATRARIGDATRSTAVLLEGQELVALAKESAGLERAMGATGLGAPEFPKAVHRRFTDLSARQRAFLQRAEIVMARPGFVDDILATDSASIIAPMREAIEALPYGGTTGDLTAPQWFAASTAWIDDLRRVETALGEEVTALSLAGQSAARSTFTYAAILLVTAVLTMTGLAVFLAERITHRLRKLTRIMGEFIAGNFDAWVPYIGARGEIGGMADAIYRFKQLTRVAQRQKEEDEASLHARHQEVVDLVTEGLDALANSDLTRRFDEPLHEEYDSIRLNFNTTVNRLREVLSMIARTVGDLESRSAQMRQTAGNLAEQTNTQTTTLQGTASSVDRLASGLKKTNTAIHDASSMARETKDRADRSGEIVRNAITAMERISESSKRIDQITAMIEDIAFQTNLLALNAGVEAARAGEAGKGFAVVASEVRELASRSAEAAMEIKKLIGESVQEVNGGVELVNRAGEALQAIVTQVARVHETLGEVSAKADQQTHDLQEVNGSMTSLRNLTENNSSVVDSTRETSNEVANSAQALARIVAEFDLGNTSHVKQAAA